MSFAIRDSRCRCGSNARLVTFRRNGDDQTPTYVCAVCEGHQAKYFYEASTLFQMGAARVERQNADTIMAAFQMSSPVRRAPKDVEPRQDDPLKMKPRYTGPRVAWDPMR